MIKFSSWVLAVIGITALLVALAGPARVHAQEETPIPTATPTPAYLQEVTLQSGNTLLIERKISFGEAAIVLALLALLAILIIWISFSVAKKEAV